MKLYLLVSAMHTNKLRSEEGADKSIKKYVCILVLSWVSASLFSIVLCMHSVLIPSLKKLCFSEGHPDLQGGQVPVGGCAGGGWRGRGHGAEEAGGHGGGDGGKVVAGQ